MNNTVFTIGVDFGSDSVRALIVSVSDGKIMAGSVCNYPRWSRGEYCNAKENRYRQHPLDYLESFTKVVRDVVSACDSCVVDNIVGISFDTTASTPAITDAQGVPLALKEEFKNDPDAMFVLWKDHTAIAEADEINELAHNWEIDYTKYSGGSYSCEWAWAKVLHILRNNPAVRSQAASWVEHCDWISGLLVGNIQPSTIARSRCVAGHKVMWNAEWDGLPSREFASKLDSTLAAMRDTFSLMTYTADHKAGTLCKEWADELGLKENIAVGIGAIDCHVGAVGGGVRDGVLVKVMGTSTCDIATASYEVVGAKQIKGICGQVDGSVLPGKIGFEAGQSAFGDVYAWYKRLLAWPLKAFGLDAAAEDRILAELTREAEMLPLTTEDAVACDWFNGRRSPFADPLTKGAISGLTLGSTAPEIFKALVEATAFGSRAIVEHLLAEGIEIQEIIAIGGIANKSRFVMQTMSDVIGLPIKVSNSTQACALGAAMFASVVAGCYNDVAQAQEAMAAGFSALYEPDAKRHEIYNALFAKYKEFAR